MAENYYLDANIWLDIYEKRGVRGEMSKKLFEKIILNDDIIYFSDLIIEELKKTGYSQYEINQIFSIAKPNNLKRVHIRKEQINEARKAATKQKVPKADALHAILARDNQFTLISRDKQDFPKLQHIWPARLPEEFI